MTDPVCPECGENEFKQIRVAQIEYTVSFEFGQPYDVAEEITDGGDRDAEYRCTECGFTFDSPEELVDKDDFDPENY